MLPIVKFCEMMFLLVSLVAINNPKIAEKCLMSTIVLLPRTLPLLVFNFHISDYIVVSEILFV